MGKSDSLTWDPGLTWDPLTWDPGLYLRVYGEGGEENVPVGERGRRGRTFFGG